MQRPILFLLCFYFTFSLFAQENRTIDGANNNLANPSWGAAGTEFTRLVPAEYGDGISTPAGANRMNPREVSNQLFAQNSGVSDNLGLSDFIWVFGQFIDHDITSSKGDPTQDASIPIDFADPFFNPDGTLTDIYIPMFRNEAAPNTGVSAVNPREHVNHITSWIDGSAVYGSDMDRANWLRTFNDGKLKTSSDNLLPWNTNTGELSSATDPNAPHMDDDLGLAPNLFVAGDSRANEQPLLTAFHTIFVREHNRLCDLLISQHPTWDDEQVYQHARKIVGAYIQNITYEEWLPAMGVHLPDYSGYNPAVNGSIFNVFAGAAFRLGHTLINGNLVRMDNDGNILPQGNLSLADAFFNPSILLESGDIDPLIKGMATQVEQALDSKMIDDVRNFLFGDPGSGSGGLDLAAININRGRERGYPDFNTIRFNLGLTPYTNFTQVCSDASVAGTLNNIYDGEVNEIDPWVGMLSEDPMADALFGETIMEIMLRQFYSLREGDRFYFENDLALSPEEVDEIKTTTFYDIIMRNTNIILMQHNVFEAMSHSEIPNCSTASNADISGNIQTFDGQEVSNVSVELEDASDNVLPFMTNEDGTFNFSNATTCVDYTIKPSKDINPLNGVSTFDLVLMVQHILNINALPTPYQILACDVNNDGNITTFDMVKLRKLILFIDTDFEDVDSWEFVDANYEFVDPTNPLGENYNQSVQINSLTGDMEQSFIGIKMGDASGDADPSGFAGSATRGNNETIYLLAQDQQIQKDQVYTLNLRSNDLEGLLGYQYTLNFDPTALEYVGFEAGALQGMTKESMGLLLEEGAITTSWNTIQPLTNDNESILYSISFKALKNGPMLSNLVQIDSRFTAAEAYTRKGGNTVAINDVALQFNETITTAASEVFELYQNQPNPFQESTVIGFNLPKAGSAEFTITDASGRIVKLIDGTFNQGYNEISIARNDLPASGVYYYEIKTATESASKKFILINK